MKRVPATTPPCYKRMQSIVAPACGACLVQEECFAHTLKTHGVTLRRTPLYINVPKPAAVSSTGASSLRGVDFAVWATFALRLVDAYKLTEVRDKAGRIKSLQHLGRTVLHVERMDTRKIRVVFPYVAHGMAAKQVGATVTTGKNGKVQWMLEGISPHEMLPKVEIIILAVIMDRAKKRVE